MNSLIQYQTTKIPPLLTLQRYSLHRKRKLNSNGLLFSLFFETYIKLLLNQKELVFIKMKIFLKFLIFINAMTQYFKSGQPVMTCHMLPVRHSGNQMSSQDLTFKGYIVYAKEKHSLFVGNIVSLYHGTHMTPHRPFNQGYMRYQEEQMSQRTWWYRTRSHFAATVGIFLNNENISPVSKLTNDTDF